MKGPPDWIRAVLAKKSRLHHTLFDGHFVGRKRLVNPQKNKGRDDSRPAGVAG